MPRRTVVVAVAIMFGLHSMPVIRAQCPSSVAPELAGTPKFELASIKPCTVDSTPIGSRGGSMNASPGRLTAHCLPVRILIQQAYLTYQNGRFNPLARVIPIEGAKDWLESDLYTIE